MDTNALNDIRDIKGLVPIPQSYLWLWILVGIVAVLLLVWWWWCTRPRPLAPQPVIPPRPPHEIALEALQKLWAERPDVEPFYTRLSDIIRRYLEDRFNLRAPERTTEEFLYEISGSDVLTAAHRELLAGFLQEADLVKFARFRPEEADMKRAFDAALRFVSEMK